MFFKIGVLKNYVTFTIKDLCWSLFLIKLLLYSLLKRDSNTGVFLRISTLCIAQLTRYCARDVTETLKMSIS